MWIEVILIAFTVWTIWNNIKKPSNYPPGPWGLPLIGFCPLQLSNLETYLSKLRKKHGEIFSWRIGSKLFVFLCEYKIIKEAYQTHMFSSRPNIPGLTLLEDGRNIGVIATNGQHWNSIRRFIIHNLRDLGMGKSKIMPAIQHEAAELVKAMKKNAGSAARISEALTPAVINVLWQMVASKRFEYDDEDIKKFEALTQEQQKNMLLVKTEEFFPWIKYIIPRTLLNRITKKNHHKTLSNLLKQFFKPCIDEHITNLDVNNPRDFIDEYLIEMEKQKGNPESIMSYEDLVGCLADLLFGGLETTSHTIIWAIFYLVTFPKVQSRLHKEIDHVLPNKTLVTVEDKSRLPYTEAFIHEVLRYSSLVAFGAMHSVLEETTLGGYTIPKDAIVFATFGEVHLEAKYFDLPTEFRPQRFLNSAGKLEIPKEGFFPFGMGKRQCLGESLARMQLFIFLTTILQHLEFSAPPGKPIDLRPTDIPLFHVPNMHQEIMSTIRK